MLKNKKIVLLISGIVTIGALIGLNLYNSKSKDIKKVYTVAKEIKKGDKINKDSYILTNIESKEIIEGAIINEDDLNNKFANTDLIKGEQFIKNRIDNIKAKDEENLREVTIKFDKLQDSNGGSLKVGDRIDIIAHNKTGIYTVGKNLEVEETLNDNGEVADKKITMIKIRTNANTEYKIKKEEKEGTLVAIKVLDNNDYQDIYLQNNQK